MKGLKMENSEDQLFWCFYWKKNH